jgi:ADP-ribose pyrophosphatase
MKRYNDASFPPMGQWDRRLTEIACPALQPVELLHENDWFAVRNRGGYYTMEYHLPHVIVLPVVENNAIVMVRVKRPVLDDVTLELPAGMSKSGEPPAEGAARELAEETGIVVADLRRFAPMPPLSPSPNRMPTLIYVFRIDLSRDEFDGRKPHDNEVESVECVSLPEASKLIASGGIYVAVPVAIISTYLLSRSANA